MNSAFALLPMLVLAASAAPAAAPAGSIFGSWLTNDGKAIIRIDHCGEKACGTVVRILDPRAPQTDIHNPKASLRNQPMAGLMVLSYYEWKDDGWRNGMAYDAKTGSSYKGTLAVGDDGKLIVTGCVMFICQSRYWTRAK